MNTLGDRIKTARKAKGMSQTELGAFAGIGKSAVSQWEKNRIKNPTAQNLLPIAKALDKDLGELLTGERGKLQESDVLTKEDKIFSSITELNKSMPEPISRNTIENFFNLSCETKAWIIFLLGNSDNKKTGIAELSALKTAHEMLRDLIERKDKEQ